MSKTIHIAARRYGKTQKCRRCGQSLGPVFQLENGKYASWRMGHRILKVGAVEAHDLDGLNGLTANVDEAVDCR